MCVDRTSIKNGLKPQEKKNVQPKAKKAREGDVRRYVFVTLPNKK